MHSVGLRSLSPKFPASIWMASDDGGLVSAVYSPSEVNTYVGKTPVHLLEETEYPFRDTIRTTVSPVAPVKFPLRLRIPGWTKEATISVNREAMPEAGEFTMIDRT
jgi:DUF1680 family protein